MIWFLTSLQAQGGSSQIMGCDSHGGLASIMRRIPLAPTLFGSGQLWRVTGPGLYRWKGSDLTSITLRGELSDQENFSTKLFQPTLNDTTRGVVAENTQILPQHRGFSVSLQRQQLATLPASFPINLLGKPARTTATSDHEAPGNQLQMQMDRQAPRSQSCGCRSAAALRTLGTNHNPFVQHCGNSGRLLNKRS